MIPKKKEPSFPLKLKDRVKDLKYWKCLRTVAVGHVKGTPHELGQK